MFRASVERACSELANMEDLISYLSPIIVNFTLEAGHSLKLASTEIKVIAQLHLLQMLFPQKHIGRSSGY